MSLPTPSLLNISTATETLEYITNALIAMKPGDDECIQVHVSARDAIVEGLLAVRESLTPPAA